MYRAPPSALRMEAVLAPPPTHSMVVLSPVSATVSTPVTSPVNAPSSASPPDPSASSPPPPLKSALKQGVRFAEEEKEDQVPLHYVMQIKRKREEKARFLQAERQRRMHEEERRQHEDEKQKWEKEHVVWEWCSAFSVRQRLRCLPHRLALARSRTPRFSSLAQYPIENLGVAAERGPPLEPGCMPPGVSWE